MAIGLPKDASGAIVPFDTTMMYRENGNQFHVSDFFFEARPRRWFARSGSECIETNKLYLESKKKVAEYRVEDEERYHVSGKWNWCPQCGKRVWPKKNE